MRIVIVLSSLALASCVAAAPSYAGNVAQVVGGAPVAIPAPAIPPVAGYPYGGHGGNGGPGGYGGNSGPGEYGGNGGPGGYGGNGGSGSGSHHGGGSGGSGSPGSGGHGSGGNGNGNGNGGGSGGNGSGGNGGGSGGNGSGGPIGNPADCGLKPGQVAALTPLVEELKLTTTVDDLKHLVHQITNLLGDTLQEDAVSSILNIVDSLVAGLGLGGLNLKPAVDSLSSIIYKQVPCLVDTLLPKP
ncbi:hypothetical protein GQ54DRAFT_298281 [Martensiomyces pterosporus]|nr:hypothetical protein GQ54DRAFT_298281 [Martensiomyces pterosporus]